MELISGRKEKKDMDLAQVKEALDGEEHEVCVRGAVHAVRDMGEITFLILRRWDGILQCVLEKETELLAEEMPGEMPLALSQALREGAALEILGTVAAEERAPQGMELRVRSVRILSLPAEGEVPPIPVSKWKMSASLEKRLSLRPVELRHLSERAVFRVQEGLVRGFRDFLHGQHFTEIRSPKIVEGNAEGGANVFKLEYFGKRAFLAQSPQFYKQMMVGVYDRVFEAAPVFRAEKHNTARHLNEYTSLDFEMGYIDSFVEIMAMEQEFLKYAFGLLAEEYAQELALLKVELPDVAQIPAVRFDEAKRLASEKYGRPIKNPYDLEPEEEHLIGQYFKEECGSEFVFVTHYPSKKRPFYAMDDPADPKVTLSFDLLFRGVEVTTGGQRIHDYRMQVEKMEGRGMDPADFEDYLMIHKYGMPPHGGLGIGLERLTMQLLGRANVRETTLFPRDVNRLHP